MTALTGHKVNTIGVIKEAMVLFTIILGARLGAFP